MPARTSPLTVGDAWTAIGYTIPSTSAVDPEFLVPLNQGVLRIVDSGSWEGCVVETVFNGSLGFLTLPAHLQSIMGVDINGWPQMVFGRFHEYAEVGPGEIRHDLAGIGPLVDMGDGFCTQTDIPAGSTGFLRIKITVAGDAGKVIRFNAENASGVEIFDATGVGFNVTTVNPSVTDTNTVSKVTGIQVQTRMVGAWTLWWVNSVGGAETQIGQYLPNELRPDYHRYKTGTWDTTIPIACICRLRHIQLYAATDFLRPGNVNAIQAVLKSIDCQGASNWRESDAAWQHCLAILNDEHKSRRGKAMYSVNFNPHGVGQSPVWSSH